jgi:guanylate kinase
MKRKGKLFVVSAPSGTGKSTILASLLLRAENLYFSISYTTRPKRPNERDGVQYHFITREKFEEMITGGEFLEHAEFAGNRYGTALAPITERLEAGQDVLLEVEVKGFKQVIEKIPDAVSIFIEPPSLEVMEQRLRNRGTDPEDRILERLKIAREEMTVAPEYDYIVTNDDLERATLEIMSIINENQVR